MILKPHQTSAYLIARTSRSWDALVGCHTGRKSPRRTASVFPQEVVALRSSGGGGRPLCRPLARREGARRSKRSPRLTAPGLSRLGRSDRAQGARSDPRDGSASPESARWGKRLRLGGRGVQIEDSGCRMRLVTRVSRPCWLETGVERKRIYERCRSGRVRRGFLIIGVLNVIYGIAAIGNALVSGVDG